MSEYLIQRGPYLLVVLVMTAGVYLMVSYRNLLKAIIGLYLVQTGIIIFFILLAGRFNATVPIFANDGKDLPLINPLPHALMLTAIVVGVATLGVAVAIVRRIQAEQAVAAEGDVQ